MTIEAFRITDIGPFLREAAAEGWISDRREMEFLLRSFPQGCFVWRDGDGQPAGFITAITYDQVGWIGNLLVRSDRRGHGIGPRLFRQAVEALSAARVKTIWLTASTLGRPIYEQIGFRSIARVERWKGAAVPVSRVATDNGSLESILAVDLEGWGGSRSLLLEQILAEDTVISRRDGFISLRRYPGFVQLGPWGALSAGVARLLFASALDASEPGETVVADVPSSNSHAAAILDAAGFQVVGSTELMVAGEAPEADLGKVYSLASMGSMG